MQPVTQRDRARHRPRRQALRDNRRLLRRAPAPPPRRSRQNLDPPETVPINWQTSLPVSPERDRIICSPSAPARREQRSLTLQMLAWMRSFGEVQRVGVEFDRWLLVPGCRAFCGMAGITTLEVTTPDRQDRRRRGKDDDFDAQNVAHAAFAWNPNRNTEKPGRDNRGVAGLECLPKDGGGGARIALQMIQHR